MNAINNAKENTGKVQGVAAVACVLFFSLGVFFIWHAGQAVWALWHEGAQALKESGFENHAREAYERTKKDLLAQQEDARTYLYRLQSDLAVKQAELVRSSQEAVNARQERAKFEKEALEKGWIKGADGRWSASSGWAAKRWWDSFWKNVDEVNQKWATVKQGADVSERLFNEAKARTDELVDHVVKQQTKVGQLENTLKEIGGVDGFEKRFKEEWDRQGLDEKFKEAKLNERASRVGFRVMAILHFTTGLLAMVLALRSFARILQLRGWCQEQSLIRSVGRIRRWEGGQKHAG